MTSDSTTRFLMLATGGMTLAMAVLVGIIAMDSCSPAEGAQVMECIEDDPFVTCDPGYVCRANRCMVEDRRVLCEEGQLASHCTCPEDLMNVNGYCRKPIDPEEAPPICEEPAVQDALAVLIQECKSRAKSLEECTTDELGEFIIDGDRFDTLLAAFPGRFSIHFPSDTPEEGTLGSWPPPEDADYIRAKLAGHKDDLEEARHIFLVARSSPSGSADYNYGLSMRRYDVVARLLRDVLGAKRRSSKHKGKIQGFLLGESKQLHPSVFKQHYAAQSIAWDEKTTDRVIGLSENLSRISRRDMNWLDNTINRTVFVIPIPCSERDMELVKQRAKEREEAEKAAEAVYAAHG